MFKGFLQRSFRARLKRFEISTPDYGDETQYSAPETLSEALAENYVLKEQNRRLAIDLKLARKRAQALESDAVDPLWIPEEWVD